MRAAVLADQRPLPSQPPAAAVDAVVIEGAAHASVEGLEAAALYRRGRQIMPRPEPWPFAGKERFERLAVTLAAGEIETAPIPSAGSAIRAEGRCGLIRDATVFAGRTRMASQSFGNLVHRVLFGRLLVHLAAYEHAAKRSVRDLEAIPMLDATRMRAVVTATANRLSCALPQPDSHGNPSPASHNLPSANFLLAQLEGQAPLDDGLLRGECLREWQRLARPAPQPEAMKQLRALVGSLD